MRGVYLLLGLIVGALAVILIVMAMPGASGLMTAPTPVPTATPTPKPTRSPIPVDKKYTSVHDTKVKVYFKEYDEIREMYLEEYMIGVVAGEVPASYRLEAVKAQAVAARTYTMYTIRHGGCSKHPGADVCTDSSCCQSFETEEERIENWPEEYLYYYSVICKAVMDTAGEVMLYDGKPIDAMYHASSGGWTEDSDHVYKYAYPYLKSVESPYEEDKYQDMQKTFTREEFVKKINAAYPEANLQAETLAEDIAILSTYPSGRVESMRLGGTEAAGTKVKKTLGLLSALFTFEVTDTEVIFHTKGYGHGVGMSQSGANGMAKQGSTYREILSHYYTGIQYGIIGQY